MPRATPTPPPSQSRRTSPLPSLRSCHHHAVHRRLAFYHHHTIHCRHTFHYHCCCHCCCRCCCRCCQVAAAPTITTIAMAAPSQLLLPLPSLPSSHSCVAFTRSITNAIVLPLPLCCRCYCCLVAIAIALPLHHPLPPLLVDCCLLPLPRTEEGSVGILSPQPPCCRAATPVAAKPLPLFYPSRQRGVVCGHLIPQPHCCRAATAVAANPPLCC